MSTMLSAEHHGVSDILHMGMCVVTSTGKHALLFSVQELHKQREQLTKERDTQLEEIVSVSQNIKLVPRPPMRVYFSSTAEKADGRGDGETPEGGTAEGNRGGQSQGGEKETGLSHRSGSYGLRSLPAAA